jgi:ribosome biogenesis GTPase A
VPRNESKKEVEDMENLENINWFPGHMAKTRRQIEKSLKLVDIVAEIVDARIPVSSRNPVLKNIIQSKPRIVLMNKCDLADPKETEAWIQQYKDHGLVAVPVDCKTGKGLQRLLPAVREILKNQIDQWNKKGMVGRPIRIMVVGIPNVGKSSLINHMCKGGGIGKAEVQDRPGVTRQNRWFTIGKGFELLDTPGVLWPKFEDKTVGELLAITGAIRDEVVDQEALAGRLLERLSVRYPQAINQRYKTEIENISSVPGYAILEQIGKKRGMLVAGGEINTERAAIAVLDEFRSGKLGKITLEAVAEQ